MITVKVDTQMNLTALNHEQKSGIGQRTVFFLLLFFGLFEEKNENVCCRFWSSTS